MFADEVSDNRFLTLRQLTFDVLLPHPMAPTSAAKNVANGTLNRA